MASTVSQTIEDIRSFRPMDIKFIQSCINDFLDEKNHNVIPNHMNYGAHIERCPKCGSVHFVKMVLTIITNRNTGAEIVIQYSTL